MPNGAILSAEAIGDCDSLHPAIISQRIYGNFGSCVIVYVDREPEERLASIVTERMANGGLNKPVTPDHIERFRLGEQQLFDLMGIGFYAASNVPRLRAAYHQHDFRAIDFGLLKTSPRAFLEAFCEACEVPVPNVSLPVCRLHRA